MQVLTGYDGNVRRQLAPITYLHLLVYRLEMKHFHTLQPLYSIRPLIHSAVGWRLSPCLMSTPNGVLMLLLRPALMHLETVGLCHYSVFLEEPSSFVVSPDVSVCIKQTHLRCSISIILCVQQSYSIIDFEDRKHSAGLSNFYTDFKTVLYAACPLSCLLCPTFSIVPCILCLTLSPMYYSYYYYFLLCNISNLLNIHYTKQTLLSLYTGDPEKVVMYHSFSSLLSHLYTRLQMINASCSQ